MWSVSLPLWLGAWLALVEPAQELAHRRAEALLLNRRLSFEGVLSGDGARAQAPPRAKVTVLHLWAVECPSCVMELTWFRTVVARYKDDKAVRFVFISETASAKELQAFLKAHRAEVPDTDHYKNAERIRTVLQNTTQPLTLLLDEELVIRQAFVGSIIDEGRKPEVVDAIRRLARLAQGG